jgi:hypothetical protein
MSRIKNKLFAESPPRRLRGKAKRATLLLH